jgi:hypothetical protein
MYGLKCAFGRVGEVRAEVDVRTAEDEPVDDTTEPDARWGSSVSLGGQFNRAFFIGRDVNGPASTWPAGALELADGVTVTAGSDTAAGAGLQSAEAASRVTEAAAGAVAAGDGATTSISLESS